MSSFAITAVSQSVNIDQNGAGAASFTVTNNTGDSLTASAKIKVLENGDESWFEIEGNQEREFSISDTQQYAVKVNIPEKLVATTCKIRLDVFSVENPDEIYAEGPAVEFKATDEKKEDDTVPPFPWWIVAVSAVAVVIGAGIIWWAMTPNTVIVPNVVQQTEADAKKLLKEAGLTMQSTSKLTVKRTDVGKVLAQTPDAETEIEKNGMVNIELGRLGVKVPVVINMKLESALDRLNRAGLAYQIYGSDTLKKEITAIQNLATNRSLARAVRPTRVVPTVPTVSKINPPANAIVEKGDVVKVYLRKASAAKYEVFNKKILTGVGVKDRYIPNLKIVGP